MAMMSRGHLSTPDLSQAFGYLPSPDSPKPLSDLGRLGMIGLELQCLLTNCDPCFLPAFQGSIGQTQKQMGVCVVGV